MLNRLCSWLGLRTELSPGQRSLIKERTRARLWLEALEAREVPATFTVDSSLDVVDPTDGVITLREAVAAANDNGPGSDTIILPAGNIVLTRGQLTINSNLTIDSVGPFTTIFRDPTAAPFRIFEIPQTVSCSMYSLNIEGGEATEGGAIKNDGSLYIQSCYLGFNKAFQNGGAISNNGDLTMLFSILQYNDAFGGSGGGIYNTHSATLASCIVQNNLANSLGGGIYTNTTFDIDVQLTVTESQIRSNASDVGGGIYVGGPRKTEISASSIDLNQAMSFGGGLAVYGTGPVNVFSTGIDENSAGDGGGGAYLHDGTTVFFDANSGFYENYLGDPDAPGVGILKRPTTNLNNQADMGPGQDVSPP